MSLFIESNDSCPVNWNANDGKSTLDMPDATASLLKAMGARTCSQGSLSGGAVVFPAGAGAFSGSYNIGCEQINLIVSKIQTFQEAIACVLTKTEVSSEDSIAIVNEVSIQISGVQHVKITTAQVAGANVVFFQKLTASAKAQIADHTKAFIEEFASALQNSKTELSSNPQGQKNVEDFSKKITERDVQESITENVVNMSFKGVSKNKVDIIINGYDTYSVSTDSAVIDITQDNVFNYQAQQVVNTALDQMFSTDQGTAVKDEIRAEQQSVAWGLGSLVSKLTLAGIGLFLAIAGGLVLFGGGVVQSTMKYIVPLAMVALLVVAVVFGLKKNYVVAGIAGVSAVIAGGFEAISLKKAYTTEK